MKQQLIVMTLALACAASVHALEYGSTAIAVDGEAQDRIEQFSRDLCGRAGATARLAGHDREKAYVHFVCEVDGRPAGDVMAKFEADQAYINFRLQ